MDFNQMVKNTLFYFYQFILPFVVNPKIQKINQHLKLLGTIKPKNNKEKQTLFKNHYIKIWKMILAVLTQEQSLRGTINYLPILQLIELRQIYIEPSLHQAIFTNTKALNAEYFILSFNLRNPEIKQKITHLFQFENRAEVSNSDSTIELSRGGNNNG